MASYHWEYTQTDFAKYGVSHIRQDRRQVAASESVQSTMIFRGYSWVAGWHPVAAIGDIHQKHPMGWPWLMTINGG